MGVYVYANKCPCSVPWAFALYMAEQSITTLHVQHILPWWETALASIYEKQDLFITHIRSKYFQEAILCSRHYEKHGQSTMITQFVWYMSFFHDFPILLSSTHYTECKYRISLSTVHFTALQSTQGITGWTFLRVGANQRWGPEVCYQKFINSISICLQMPRNFSIY